MKYLMTVGEFSRKVGISSATTRIYADVGLIDCFYTSRGDRLFLEGAIEQARKARVSRTRKAAPALAQVGNGG
jgi:DNA-binding transcriptional MerR regulator